MQCPPGRASLRAGQGKEPGALAFLPLILYPSAQSWATARSYISHVWENACVWGQESTRIQEILGHTSMPRQGGEGAVGSSGIFERELVPISLAVGLPACLGEVGKKWQVWGSEAAVGFVGLSDCGFLLPL